jgi:hypothetical protein
MDKRANETAPAREHDGRFLRVLPFYIQPIVGDPELEIPMPVALWKRQTNCCEGGGETRCDDSEGLCYTIAGDEVTWWCPRHWYEGVLGPDAPYRLLDMTDAQHRTEVSEHRERILKDWAVVSDRLESAARILGGRGLQDEAGRLWHAHGWVRSSITGR